jgi:hypothetical protein
VPVAACPGQYAFDPTGRDIPLFAAGERAYGDAWVSPAEWQLPTPIDRLLWRSERENLYATFAGASLTAVSPRSLGVYVKHGSFFDLLSVDHITADANEKQAAFYIDPERGRLVPRKDAPAVPLRVTYHYGFSSTIGAGPYDRSQPDRDAAARPAPETAVSGGDNGLAAPLAALGAQGTVTVDDSLTYGAASDLANIRRVTVRGENGQRPVLRLPDGGRWALHGADDDSQLYLEGLFVSGGDIVLTGTFASVQLICCTLDPGNRDPSGVAQAVDGRALVPCRLRVEGSVRQLTFDRCLAASVHTGKKGLVEQLEASDSIFQALGGRRIFHLRDTEVVLSRCTLLGPARVHRMSASECILDGVTNVDDTQHGCVRFTAFATGSVLPRQYESVAIATDAPLFTSRAFGRPGYAQLIDGAPPAVAEGAEDGSEMGAFAREKGPLKERGLLIKYDEYMPVGLTPVLIHVT